MIRVLLADDQALVRGGFRVILDSQADIEVVGEAADGKEAIRLTAELRPDVVLMDIRMPNMDGLEATRRIATASEAPRIVMLTTFDADEHVYEAMRAGASGFLLKDLTARGPRRRRPDRRRGRHAARERRHPAAGRALRPPAPPGAQSDLQELTAREREVLELIARGRSNAEIAAALFVSEGTVKTHVTHVLQKLGLRDRVQAVIFAYESGRCRARRLGRGGVGVDLPDGAGDRVKGRSGCARSLSRYGRSSSPV